MSHRIEHLLSAPLFLAPQVRGDRIFFISDLSSRLSLWAMDVGGSVPEPLLPPDVGLFTPGVGSLTSGGAFVPLPDLGVIVVMIDRAGDEMHQPHLIGIDGGEPEPLFGDRFTGQQVSLNEVDPDGVGTIMVDPRTRPEYEAYQITVRPGEASTAELIGTSEFGGDPIGHTEDRSSYLLVDFYTIGDATLWLAEPGKGDRRLLQGVPPERRVDGAIGEGSLAGGFKGGWFVADESAVLTQTTVFDDAGGLARFDLEAPESIAPVEIVGTDHPAIGELSTVSRLDGDRYLLHYNIDGASVGYTAEWDDSGRRMVVDRRLFGGGVLTDGVVKQVGHDRSTGRLVVSFSSSDTPAQLALIEPPAGGRTPAEKSSPATADGPVPVPSAEPRMVTRNRVLGVDAELFARGEDASFDSHDGLRIPARLYLPAERLGFTGPRPLVYYIHGGPQGQERPDYTWFSMPLIQFFTLRGFAAFVPNVRGSSGYGQSYMRRVDRDWGGQDRLDHVAAVEALRADPRVDTDRIGVMGRSYGGFMTQTLVGRHPDLWRAGVAMFGPYDLLVWTERLPPTWRTYVSAAVGDPERDRDLLIDRSPRTHLSGLACPLLVIQGANDSRVMRAESDDLVAELRAAGKDVDYLVFEDEGHDLTKHENKVRCYNAIVEFFERHLMTAGTE